MRLVTIGDSTILFNLTLNLEPEDTYGFILKEYFESKGKNETYIIGTIGNNTSIQSNSIRIFYDIKQFEPQIVVINLGIVDCGIQALTNSERIFLNSVPEFDMKKIKFYNKFRYAFFQIKKIHIKINDFQKNYQEILTEIKKINAIPIILNIIKPRQNYLKKSFAIIQNVKKYNLILTNLAKKNQCVLIDLYSLTESDPKMLLEEEFHLSKYGHEKLAQLLIQKIESLII